MQIPNRPHLFSQLPVFRAAAILACLLTGASLFAQPALTVTSISGQGGDFSLQDDVTFTFTVTNTTQPAEGGGRRRSGSGGSN